MTLIKAFVREAERRRPGAEPVVACFYAVRGLPYALDGAHDAHGLLLQQRGDCLAKSELMVFSASELGVPARFVRWRYLLPEVVPEATGLPSRLDVHRAAQLFVAGTWVLVDPAHHPGLSSTALLVNEWDGVHDTRPCYPPVGPMMVDDEAAAAVSEAMEDVRRWTANCSESVLASWRSAYIAWLRQHE